MGRPGPKGQESIDNRNQTDGASPEGWCKILEDLGFQYDLLVTWTFRKDP